MQKLLKIAIIVILTGFFGRISSGDSDVKETRLPQLIDGLTITTAEGTLDKIEGEDDRWVFLFESDVNEPPIFVPRGATIALLPCSWLEKLVADANDNPGSLYRIRGTLAVYRGQNFIFLTYFLPLSRGEYSGEQIAGTPRLVHEEEPAINEANDVIKIPDAVLSRLRTRRTMPIDAGAALANLPADTMLANRTGFINTVNGIHVFTFDALGRNTENASLELLPCRALELAQSRQAAVPDSPRFKVAGIITQYKDRQYFFLQRAAVVYSHGNFAR